MMLKVQPGDVDLRPQADDPEDTGEGLTAGTCLFRSADRRYQLGLWYFKGERHEPANADGFDELLVVLDGSVEIECDGQLVQLVPGDMLVYSSPVGPKRVSAPDGVRLAWCINYTTANGEAR